MTDNPADRSGDVDREPLKEKLEEITSTNPEYTCISCEEVIEEDEEMLSVNGQTVHEECFIKDMDEEVKSQ